MNISFSAVLKLLKMAVGMRALLDTVMQALPQVTFWLIAKITRIAHGYIGLGEKN